MAERLPTTRRLLCVPEAEAAARAGELVAEALLACKQGEGHARLAVSGGSAAAALPFVRQIVGPLWSSICLTWVDERCVEFDDADSNRGTAYRSGALSESEAPGVELPLWLTGETQESAQARVREGLQNDFSSGLDVALLGMGPDGHIASLFPGHPILDLPAKRMVAALSDSPKPPPSRLTLTRSLLQTSNTCILVALGQAKKPALERLLQADPALPASHLRNLTIITNLDMGAAS